MSGAEAVAVLGGISAIITMIEKCQQLYSAAKSIQGLPDEFQRVNTSLPLVKSILSSVEGLNEDRQATGTVSDPGTFDESVKNIEPILAICKGNAKSLEKIFKKVFTGEDAGFLKRYAKAARALKLGRRGQVENLTKEILEKLQLLHTDQSLQFYRSCLRPEDVAREIASLSGVESSLSQEQGNVNSGSGPMNISYGSGNVTSYHHGGKGDMFTGTVNQYSRPVRQGKRDEESSEDSDEESD